MSIIVEDRGSIRIVTMNRPQSRNAMDRETAQKLFDTFVEFDGDDSLSVAVLAGADGTFCSGADLHAVSSGNGNRIEDDPVDEIIGSLGPMGPTRLLLDKPVIAAIEGYAVAGGLELAVWCDLRVMAEDASFGVFCRRWGVPLVDGGTIRLSRLIGHSRALDMILTGREVASEEALQFGLANRVVPAGTAIEAAIELAQQLSALPQNCMRSDRRSSYDQWSLDLPEAMSREIKLGIATVKSGETVAGATRFKEGAGRGGKQA